MEKRPANPYGESKLMIEQILRWADEVYGFRSACLRYFNAAGADPDVPIGEDHSPETHLIPIALEAVLEVLPVGKEWSGLDLPDTAQGAGADFDALEKLRRACPCAGCHGEVDILGNLYKSPDKPLPPTAFELVRFTQVGGYAIQPTWRDGHNSGIFSFDYLRRLAGS